MKKIIAVFVVLFFCSGCDQFTWFQSEGSVRKKIQGTWIREFLEIKNYNEDWIFQDGTVTIVHYVNSGAYDTIDDATYQVNTSLFSAHVKMEGFDADSSVIFYNQNWTIIDLDEKVLFIVADIGAGLVQREFVKKD